MSSRCVTAAAGTDGKDLRLDAPALLRPCIWCMLDCRATPESRTRRFHPLMVRSQDDWDVGWT
eukprot:15478923-Alexandrium_andersonii.AAC.1